MAISIDFDPSPLFRDKLVWSYVSDSEPNSGTVTVGYDLYDDNKDPHLIGRIPLPPISHSLYFNESIYYHKEGGSLSISKFFGSRGTQGVLRVLLSGENTLNDFSIAHRRSQPGTCRHGNPSGVG